MVLEGKRRMTGIKISYKGPRTMCSNGCTRERAGRIGHSFGERLLMRPTGDADAIVVLCMGF